MSNRGSAWFKRKRIPYARDLLRKAIIPGDVNAVEETVFTDFWFDATPAPPGGFQAAWARGCNTILGGGNP